MISFISKENLESSLKFKDPDTVIQARTDNRIGVFLFSDESFISSKMEEMLHELNTIQEIVVDIFIVRVNENPKSIKTYKLGICPEFLFTVNDYIIEKSDTSMGLSSILLKLDDLTMRFKNDKN